MLLEAFGDFQKGRWTRAGHIQITEAGDITAQAAEARPAQLAGNQAIPLSIQETSRSPFTLQCPPRTTTLAIGYLHKNKKRTRHKYGGVRSEDLEYCAF
ncbi:unnamed protein product, partial [Iphiclides podalirius]